MKLPIPLITQAPESMDCQVATALMQLHWLEDRGISFEELRALNTLPEYAGTRHTHVMARILQERGFETFFAFHEGAILDHTLENKTEKDLQLFREAFLQLEVSEKTMYRRTKLNMLLEYVAAGGTFSTSLPTLATIDSFLDRNIPVALGVEFRSLHLRPSAQGGNHSVLVIGKEQDQYWINDPMPSTEGQFLVHQDRLLHAWYNSGGAYLLAAWESSLR